MLRWRRSLREPHRRINTILWINILSEAYKDFRTSRALLFDNASAEYTLDQTEAFNEFGELLESLIEKFAEERSLDARVIYTECRDISEGAFTALFEEHEHKYVTNFSSSYLLLLRLIPADGLSICYWNGQILNNLQALWETSQTIGNNGLFRAR